MVRYIRDDELYHYGRSIKDGAPGVGTGNWRRNSVFISGSSKTQDEASDFYRKDLPEKIRLKVDEYISRKKHILVGDAPGIDRQIQNYLKDKQYKRVRVYSPGTEARYLADENWKNVKVNVRDAEAGSKEWLAGKDKAMRRDSEEGMAVVIPNGASATRRNIYDFIEKNKNVTVFELNNEVGDRELMLDEILEDYRKHKIT